MSDSPAVFCAACNEPGHSRRTYRFCRMNPRNQVDEDVQMEEVQQEQTQNDVVVCSACNEPGHSRRTFAGCRMNPRFQDMEVDGQPSAVEVCANCGMEGHLRRTSRLCPLNTQNTRNVARDLSAVPSMRFDCGSMSCICDRCGALMWIRERASGSSKIHPVFQLCCCKGESILSPLQPTPPEIADLLKGSNSTSKEFRSNIRMYNSSLSFTSFGVNLDLNLANSRTGSYTFRIQGSPYHLIGSAIPSDNSSPKFAQIYIFDTEHELENRHAIAQNVDRSTLLAIQNMMHRVNPFVAIFKNMTQIAAEQQSNNDTLGQNEGISSLENVKLVFRAEGVPDRRRYNRPTNGSQIAAIIVGGDNDDNAANTSRDIVIQYQDSSIVRVNESNQFYDPLHYVLLFPFGEPGWSITTLSNSSNEKMTIMQFYSFRLMYRPSDGHLLHLFGNLFHQYIVDMYTKMEQNRLLYIRHNQKSLRCELYQGLQDAVNLNDGLQPANQQERERLGKKVILPSSFIGGPRHMAQLYQDALSIVRRFGKPDYFITFTCNPQWPEIQRELLFGQKASDRPDLCSRVFNIKLRELLDDLTKKNVLGKAVGFVYTIEFQKRGLPHAHILLIVDSSDKPLNAEEYDSVVSAEIPDPVRFPLAHQTVIKHMIHGPCGIINTQAVCMDIAHGCSKKYPKAFSNETTANINGGYPVYRRRNNGITVPKTINRHTYNIDNRWVVPHNLYLATKYDAHINVEICSSINSVKYVYKYVYKGHDRASLSVEQNDEVRSFIDARYVSAPEACWRLFSFPMHKEFPAHQRLAIHLEGEESVYFNEDDDINAVLMQASEQDTTLTSWFKTNQNDPEARSIFYPNFPEQYVWHTSVKPRKWAKRQRGFGATIGRVYSVSPKRSELYHLRMLLYHVAGATSFAHLRTVNGICHPTFQAAARALGLLASDNQWKQCLDEAAHTQTPVSLRKLFCIVLVFCDPADPYQLWLDFKDKLSEDYLYQLQNDSSFDPVLNDINDTSFDRALLDIESILTSHHGSSLRSYGQFQLPIPDPSYSAPNSLIQEQLRLNTIARQTTYLEDVTNFNSDQLEIYQAIMQCVERDGCNSTEFPRLFFVDGPGGTGKTYLFNTLLKAVRSGHDGFALAVASSGTAALLMAGGRTAHSMFKIPLETSSTTMCGITPSSMQAQLLRKTKLIIWDESSMINKSTLETVDRTFKDIFGTQNKVLESVPFGGRLMVFGGDFRQVLPVIPKGSRSDVVNACINRSFLWPSFTVKKLQINMRVQQAQNSNNPSLSLELEQFANMLLNIGNGSAETLRVQVYPNFFPTDTDFVKLLDSMLIPGDNLLNLLSAIYPELFNPDFRIGNDTSYLISSAILTPINVHVAEINRLLIEKLPGEQVIYYSADETLDLQQSLEHPMEVLNVIESGALPPHVLTLKVGAPIMLLRNLDALNGLCNGTRLIVKSLMRNLIEATIETGAFAGSVVCIPKIKLFSAETDAMQFQRIQFPIRLAFAMTINKAQGQTLDRAGLYLPKPVFSHGQLYVALSRVRQKESIKILIGKSSSIPAQYAKNHTRNVVYKEVFT